MGSLIETAAATSPLFLSRSSRTPACSFRSCCDIGIVIGKEASKRWLSMATTGPKARQGFLVGLGSRLGLILVTSICSSLHKLCSETLSCWLRLQMIVLLPYRSTLGVVGAELLGGCGLSCFLIKYLWVLFIFSYG